MGFWNIGGGEQPEPEAHGGRREALLRVWLQGGRIPRRCQAIFVLKRGRLAKSDL